MTAEDPPLEPPTPRPPGLLALMQSVLAAAIGVQSERNRARDAAHGSLPAFVVAALTGTVIFVLAVAGVVTPVLQAAGR